ncbi:hypothetical protein HED63_27325 [Ochrobactrum cytisi]|nr:hypothetical protein [Brucella cytisi]
MAGEAVLGRALLGAGARAAAGGPLAALGPLGWVAIGALTLYDGYQLYNAMSESAEAEPKPDKKPEECTEGCEKPLPDNPDDLLEDGWEETSHPKAKEAGRRTFRNPKTGEELVFDKGKPGQPGWEGGTIITVQTQTARAVTMSTRT